MKLFSNIKRYFSTWPCSYAEVERQTAWAPKTPIQDRPKCRGVGYKRQHVITGRRSQEWIYLLIGMWQLIKLKRHWAHCIRMIVDDSGLIKQSICDLFRHPLRRLIIRAHKYPKLRDWTFKWPCRFEHWQMWTARLLTRLSNFRTIEQL